MKIQHLENGSLIVTQGSKPIFVILGISVFLLLAKDAFLWIFTVESTLGKQALAASIIMLTLLFFYRVWSLRSKFEFDSVEKSLYYTIQYPFFNKNGRIPTIQIEKAIVETDSDNLSRIVIKCENETIAMSAGVKALSFKEYDLACNEINKWLEKNA